MTVLKSASAVIFVADSEASKLRENIECWQELQEQLRRLGRDMTTFPLVFQWNRRNVTDALPVHVLEQYLNPYHLPSYEATSEMGRGVIESFQAAIEILLKHMVFMAESSAKEEPI
jgi:hypothetical protein